MASFQEPDFNQVALFSDKPVRYVFGDLNEHFIVLARNGCQDFTLAYEELANSTFYCARIGSPNDLPAMYRQMNLDGAPGPLSYPSDIVVAFCKEIATMCRPVPVSMGINHWMDQIYKNQQRVHTGVKYVHHPVVAAVFVRLLLHRSPETVETVLRSGKTIKEFYREEVKYVTFCLNQNRPVKQWSV